MALLKKKKVSTRRQQVRDNLATERFSRLAAVVNSGYPKAFGIFFIFILATTAILGLELKPETISAEGYRSFLPWPQLLSLLLIVATISTGISLYIHHYKPQILQKTTRLVALGALFWILLAVTHIFSFNPEWKPLSVGAAVACAIVLTIAYDQRFAIGLVMFYTLLAAFAVDQVASVELVIIMAAGALSCCFSLREIRTRKKLIEVSLLSTIVVFLTTVALGLLKNDPPKIYYSHAGTASAATFIVGIFIQAFLPIIEQAFGIATSMTLMDYSDANQPLLRKLAMEAPGTFTHSLIIGSISESAAESIGANGLLCRVGAYYHDIGKIHKPAYFVENQMGSVNRHEQLSPAMSQLVIAGHVKDGMEIAREFGLPAVLRQFIETHHGTTLMEYFYHEAKKRQEEKQGTVAEAEFRYPGPKPKSKEAAIVMLGDAVESACRTLNDPTPTKVETLVHTIAMKRLQDGQFDECDLTLRELSKIEESLSKSLAAHHHGRIAYPSDEEKAKSNGNHNGKGKTNGNGKNNAPSQNTNESDISPEQESGKQTQLSSHESI
jgi:putative nucleotidyltransferase with HDIG domain